MKLFPQVRNDKPSRVVECAPGRFLQNAVDVGSRPVAAGAASGSMLGAAYLCVPFLGPLLAWVALLPLLAFWRDKRSLKRSLVVSVVAMGIAQSFALGYFFPFDPPTVTLVIGVQTLAASLPWLGVAMAHRFVAPAAALWSLPPLWLLNDWAWSFIPQIVPTPLGGALGGLPSGIWFYGWTGVSGGTFLLLACQVWLIQPRPSQLLRLGVPLALCGLIHGIGNLLAEVADNPEAITEIALLRTGPRGNGEALFPWFDRAMILTAHAAEAGAQLVVWPEGALPAEVGAIPDHPLQQAVVAITKRHGVPLLFGQDEASGRTLYNSAALLQPGEELGDAQRYRKRWLLPYKEGRYLFGLGPSWLSAGETSRSLVFVDRYGQRRTIGPLICYEALISAAAVEQVRAGAEILIVLANDVEFAATPALWQLEAQSRVRAVETGREVLRVATTGALQHFDARGRKRMHAEGEVDFVLSRVPFHSAESFYVRHPHWLPLAVLCFGLVLGITPRLRRIQCMKLAKQA